MAGAVAGAVVRVMRARALTSAYLARKGMAVSLARAPYRPIRVTHFTQGSRFGYGE